MKKKLRECAKEGLFTTSASIYHLGWWVIHITITNMCKYIYDIYIYIYIFTSSLSSFVMVTAAPWQWVLPRQQWHGNHWSFEQKALGHTSQHVGCEKEHLTPNTIQMLDFETLISWNWNAHSAEGQDQSNMGRIWPEVIRFNFSLCKVNTWPFLYPESCKTTKAKVLKLPTPLMWGKDHSTVESLLKDLPENDSP